MAHAALYVSRAALCLRTRLYSPRTRNLQHQYFGFDGNTNAAGMRAVTAPLSDLEWLEVLTQSRVTPSYRGIRLPGFPEERVQERVAGSVGARALRDAFNFYSLLKRLASRYDQPIDQDSIVLDFGCGWGRIIRFFLKDVSAEYLHGVDADQELVDFCKQTLLYGYYERVEPTPPSCFDDGRFNLIYAYSVFSHLSEPVHLQWLAELSRILAPGGLLVVTTQSRHFLEFCADLRRDSRRAVTAWQRTLSSAFTDTAARAAAYDRGEFLHEPTGGGSVLSSAFYGETIIPAAYVERHWTRYLAFRTFLDDPRLFRQAIVVMQKT